MFYGTSIGFALLLKFIWFPKVGNARIVGKKHVNSETNVWAVCPHFLRKHRVTIEGEQNPQDMGIEQK